MQQRPGVEDRHQPVAAVRSAALDDLAVDRGDLAGFLHAQFQPDIGFGAAAVREEAFLARELGPDQAARCTSERCRDHFEVERFDTVTEAAADEWLDHANLRAVHRQALRQCEVQVVRHLCHRVHGEALALRLVGGDRGVELDLAVGNFGVVERLFANEIGGGEARVDVTEELVDFALDVAALLLVQGTASGARASAALK